MGVPPGRVELELSNNKKKERSTMHTIMITGANRGIGLEFARQYASDGWRVIATCRNPAGAGDLAAIEGEIEVYGLDVADGSQVESLVKELKGTAVDVLVNNAGIGGAGNVDINDLDYEEWLKVFRVNTLAPIRVSVAFLPNVAAGKLKRIVTVSSGAGSLTMNVSVGTYAYNSSKTAVNAVMKRLSTDLQEQGITVAVLSPGWVKTDMGGPDAVISPTESISGMREVIEKLTLESTGRFINYDGAEIPW